MSKPRTLRLPFKDELVLAIAAGEKLETRRLSPPKAQAGDVMAVCEALVPGEPTESAPFEWVSYRADGLPVLQFVGTVTVPTDPPMLINQYECMPWPWQARSLAPRYFPTTRFPHVVRHRRTLVEVRREPLRAITDQGARDEGIARLGWAPTRDGFIRGFLAMHKLPPDADPLVTVYRWSRLTAA